MPSQSEKGMPDHDDSLQLVAREYPDAAPFLRDMLEQHPALRESAPDLTRAFEALMRCFRSGGTLYICGNGGSMSDALHIAGELDKSFFHPRKLTEAQRQRLLSQPDGRELADALQQGLRTVPLGTNPALTSAVANDNAMRDVSYAQELYALAHAGDVLLGISTSGNAKNVRYTASVAHALDMVVIALTGPDGGSLAKQADIAIRTPGASTPDVQGNHIQLYHTLCLMLEAAAFGAS